MVVIIIITVVYKSDHTNIVKYESSYDDGYINHDTVITNTSGKVGIHHIHNG